MVSHVPYDASYEASKQIYMYSLIICILYACSDEIHQYFVGRSASVLDVVLDMIGGLSSMPITYFFKKCINRGIKCKNG